MDLRQLEYFVTVAEQQHFTHAAARLNVVQSGLSASIRALEDEFGAKLFQRTTRKVALTPMGQAFLTEARRVLAAAADARKLVADMRGLRRGRLSIGSIRGLAPLLDIAALIGGFHEACPEIEIRLASGDSGPLIEDVRSGELDLAFAQFVGAAPVGISAWMLACEPLVVVCKPRHRLAGLGDITLAELAGETFVDLNPDCGTRQLIDESFASARVSRHIGFEVNDLPTQLDLVARGLGIALMPAAVVAGDGQPSVALATLAEPAPCWELAVVFAHDVEGRALSPAAQMFLDLLKPMFPEWEPWPETRAA
jgi:DNA-binding transcriptional LysR family regulator